MDVREKLVELANGVLQYLPWGEIQKDTAERIADRMMDNGVTVQKWIPVSERLPEAYTDVLAYRESGCEVEFCLDVKNGFWQNDPISEYLVTHWMPMPQPPKGE